jgi:putative ABC transport system substrate-binding protein
MIDRRRLVSALGAACVAVPAAWGQQRAPRRIGFLMPRLKPASLESPPYGGFFRGMRAQGYEEGRDYIMEWRFAEGKPERAPLLAAELLQWKPDLLVGATFYPIQALVAASRTIPIVMASVGDPVKAGFVHSLARPGGNVTGVVYFSHELNGKRLQLLRQVVPGLARVGALTPHPDTGVFAGARDSLHEAAATLQMQASFLQVATAPQLETAFAELAQRRMQGVVVATDGLYAGHRTLIADLARRHRLPAMYGEREYVDAGGLASYGQSLSENFRRTASLVDRILKGAPPRDLPVEQPTEFELVVSRKEAAGLKLALGQELLLQATQVLE